MHLPSLIEASGLRYDFRVIKRKLFVTVQGLCDSQAKIAQIAITEITNLCRFINANTHTRERGSHVRVRGAVGVEPLSCFTILRT